MANNQKKLDDFFRKSQNQEEPEGLKKYISDINKGVDPTKLTFADRIAGFFKNLVEKVGVYYPGRQKKEATHKPSTFRRKLRIIYRNVAKKIADKFNFEAGVDILDDTSVLYRRNLVNKNILIVSNLVFIVFTLIGNQNPRYAIIIVFAIIMLIINTTLKKIIHEEPRTLLKQQMAMYIGSVYILFGSFAVYMKLKLSAVQFTVADVLPASGTVLTRAMIENIENDFIAKSLFAMTDASIAQAGYILIYFALVVIALYQDSKLLGFLFKWVFAMLLTLHLFVLYPLYQLSGFSTFYDFLFVTNNNVLIDIVLRTLLLIVFYIALYSSVSIGEMMNNKRKEELVKRRAMEIDFKAVVGDVFDVIGVFNSNTINQSKEDAHRVAELASRLASVLGLSSNVCTEIYDYSVIYIDRLNDLSILEYETKEVLNERDYTVIREKTILGSIIIKRLQLNQKSEDIIRAHFEKTVESGFTERMKRVQRSQEGEIILLAEMYNILRQNRNYKNPLKHKRVIDLLKLEFKEYFEPYILDRFMKYQLEFETFYDKYKYIG
ncbi:MAG: hypothetical protein KAH16_00380 [Candidatus Izimaplasma sp.]|nr:hypothetical protein [Candidatus Izimaplasma bacterium]